MQPRAILAEMTREQIRAIAPTTTVVLPTAAIEQHGPHLAIVTDTLACTTVCQRGAEIANQQGGSVTVAPPIHFGMSHHHFPHPGVLSLTQETFITVIREVCDSLHRSGFRKIVIINGHGGNDDAIRVAARDVSLVHDDISIAAASYWTIAHGALVEEGKVHDIGQLPGHAGAFETSLVMGLRPDLVDTASYPTPIDWSRGAAGGRGASIIRAGARLGTGPGYTDNPANASAEAGQRFLAIIARELAAFFGDVGRG